MKKLFLFTMFTLGFSQFAAADYITRSIVHTFTRYGTARVKAYDLDKVYGENQKAEDAAVTAARQELHCHSSERLDVAQIKISPESVNIDQDQSVSVQIIGICLPIENY